MKSRNVEGFALLAVLIVGLALACLAALISTRSVKDSGQAQSFTDVTRSIEAAESGLDVASSKLWTDYLATNPAKDGSAGTLTNFTKYTDGILLNGDTNKEMLGAKVAVGGQSTVDSLKLTRQDNATGVAFTVASLGTSHQRSRTITQSMTVSGGVFGGFEYALLSRNISCLLCHANFDNVDRVMNSDKTKYGTFPRVKVAALDSTMVRHGAAPLWDAQTHVAGSFYSRGQVNDQFDTILGDLTGTTITADQIDSKGNMIQDGSGNLFPAVMNQASTDSKGFLNTNQNLYMNYPADTAHMTDGNLPSNFPSIVPDVNNNRIIDASEWSDLVNTAKADGSLGGIKGGVAYGLPAGSKYAGTNLPAASNSASTPLASGNYDGNAFLVGTAANPIQIDGKVTINGDVVISGPIKGTGQIYAKGNIYFAGDTTYADSAGQFGQTGTGSSATKNLVAYAAGGNILMGDYLSPFYEDMNSKTYKTDVVGKPVLNTGQYMSFPEGQTAIYNKDEYDKAVKDPSYIPRLYTINPGDTVVRGTTDAETLYFDSNVVPITAAQLGSRPVVYSSFTPTGDWLSSTAQKTIWAADNASRPAAGRPFSVDGLLYTSNAIIMISKGTNLHSRTNGMIQVRGGVVTSDVGILGTAVGGTTGFNLLWDKRTANFLSVPNVGNLHLTRALKVISTL